MIKGILQKIEHLSYVHMKDIPNIDLYMDQITSFMEIQLKNAKRYDSDKILTKTMINNYAKNRLLPPPIKKKYSKEHLLILIFIYYYKNILNFADIETILKPLTERYFYKNADISLVSIYEELVSIEKESIDDIKAEVLRMYTKSEESFESCEDREYLQLFAFICELSFDIYIKKMILENLIDELRKNP